MKLAATAFGSIALSSRWACAASLSIPPALRCRGAIAAPRLDRLDIQKLLRLLIRYFLGGERDRRTQTS